MKTPGQILSDTFGFDEFRPHQEEIIASVLSGRDALVVMPTGGGKSLCFQVPALVLEGTAIVVSPLIALMKDQVDFLCSHGVRAAFYNSSLEAEEARSVLARLHAGELDLIYVAPERLVGGSFTERLLTVKVSLLAIDEAHCVSQWGHDFRPEYARLSEVREVLGHVPTIALTATADTHTREDIVAQLKLREPKVFVTGFDRPNISYAVVDKRKPREQLVRFLETHEGESGIVYALSRKRVEEVAGYLREQGVRACAYHAGLPGERRSQVHEQFIRDEVDVVVATVAFGMGIDKPDIRFVVHYDIPKNIEGYYQETGRAGRDGLAAEALLLLGYQDVMTARSLVEGGGNAGHTRLEINKLNHMVAFAESLTCRRQVLLRYFGENREESCGNCDICRDPPQRYDATEHAQKALSCVYRVGQRFGARHVVNVLRGMNTEQIRRSGHKELSTYAIGADLSEVEWLSVIRQLVHRGFLYQDASEYNVLKLTGQAHQILKGEQTIDLAKPRVRLRSKTGGRKRRSIVGDLEPDSVELFELLRTLRGRIAKDQGTPPYMVFGDKSLMQMATYQPTDDDSFLSMHGVGQSKLSRYGPEFMEAIRSFVNQDPGGTP